MDNDTTIEIYQKLKLHSNLQELKKSHVFSLPENLPNPETLTDVHKVKVYSKYILLSTNIDSVRSTFYKTFYRYIRIDNITYFICSISDKKQIDDFERYKEMLLNINLFKTTSLTITPNQKIKYIARYNKTTGKPNKVSWTDRLEQLQLQLTNLQPTQFKLKPNPTVKFYILDHSIESTIKNNSNITNPYFLLLLWFFVSAIRTGKIGLP